MPKLQQARDDAVAQADKLDREVDILQQQMDRLAYPDQGTSDRQVELLVSQAKRVRRESTFLVQLLAELRDNLQPQEAQGNE